MFKILDKQNGEVTAEQQAVFNKISTNNADGYVDGFLNSLRIAKMSSNVISIDSGLLSIQGFRSVNDTLATYTVSVTPSEPIPFQLVATYSHYISDENDTLEITTRPTQELRREPLFSGQNAVYEVELAEFNMTADGITDFKVTLEKIVYNEQDLTELLDKVTKAEANSATALEKVKELETQVIEKQGTVIKYGTEAQNEVVFDSDPQAQIDDIVDGTTPAGNANKLGGTDAASYAKLAQVVRTDAAQSLTTAEKQQAQNNIAITVTKSATSSGQAGWWRVAQISQMSVYDIKLTQTYNTNSPAQMNVVASVGYMNNTNAVLSLVSGFSASRYTPSKIRVCGNTTACYLDIYTSDTTWNKTVVEIKGASGSSISQTEFSFIGTSDTVAGYNVVILDLVSGVNTSGKLYQNGASVFATDPSALTPSTDNGWTQTTTSGTLPSEGVYWIAAENVPSGSQPAYFKPALLPYDGEFGTCDIVDTTGLLVCTVVATTSGITFRRISDYTAPSLTAVYYKRITQ